MAARAIRSVLAQTFQDFELIVADDGSSLNYGPTRDEFANDPRVRFIRAKANRGAAAARNLGIAEAAGGYVAFLDDDDEFLSSFLQATYETLETSEPSRRVTFCGVQWLDDGSADGKPSPTRTLEFETVYPDERSILETFLSIGTGYGLCISAECLNEVGNFNESLRTTEDTELFLRIADGGFLPSVTQGVHLSIHDHEGMRLTGTEMFSVNIKEIQQLLNSFDRLFARYPSLRTQLIAHMRYLSGLLSDSKNAADDPASLQPGTGSRTQTLRA